MRSEWNHTLPQEIPGKAGAEELPWDAEAVHSTWFDPARSQTSSTSAEDPQHLTGL